MGQGWGGQTSYPLAPPGSQVCVRVRLEAMGCTTPHVRVIHCIWTLEGLGAFNLNVCNSCGRVCLPQ